MAKKKVVKKKVSKKKTKKKGSKSFSIKVGRPTKYLKEYDHKLIEHMEKGYSFRSFASLVNVNFDTVYEWAEKHTSFSDAKKIGEAKSMYAYEVFILNAAKGFISDFNSTAAIWFGKNVHKWRDKEKDDDQKATTINIIIDKDDDEL